MVALNNNLAPGLLTSLNTGAVDGGVGERVLIDYKDAIQDYKVVDLPALSMFTYPMTTETGGELISHSQNPQWVCKKLTKVTLRSTNTPTYAPRECRSMSGDWLWV